MKNLLFLMLFLPFIGYAQVDTAIFSSYGGLPLKGRSVVFETITEINSTTKETFYAASKKWITEKIYRGKINSQDPETGQILGYGSTSVAAENNSTTIASIDFKYQIDCKNDKSRLRIFEINIRDSYNLTGYGMPIELYSSNLSDKQIKPKNLEKVRLLRVKIKDALTLLANSYDETVKASVKDTF